MQTETATEPVTETAEVKPTYRLLRLTSKNFKRLRAIDITPNGNVIRLSGKNEGGKSSVLQSIFTLLTGKVCDRPIRDGQSKAEISGDFGAFTATLTFTANGTCTLKVKAANGTPINSPRTFLQSLCNPILLDPIGFIHLGDTAAGRREQAEQLRQLVGLDFTALDAEKAQLYAERTNVNRDAANAKSRLSSFPLDPTAPDEERSSAELFAEQKALLEQQSEELRLATEHNDANEAKCEALNTLINANARRCSDIEQLSLEIKELLRQLKVKEDARERLRVEADLQSENIKTGQAIVAALVDKDLDAIKLAHTESQKPIAEKQTSLDEDNRKARNNKRHKELAKEAAEHEAKSEKLSARIKEIEQSKADHLAKASFPLSGLSFNEDGILLNNLPFTKDQCSHAQLCKAAVAIGFAFKPQIPLVLIEDASLFDSESLAEVAAMAEKYDGCVWEEFVESDDPGCIEITDGSILE